jgi:hypothetical protein
VCAEKCKRVKGNCDAAFQAKLGHPPAPKCTWYSETHADDPYWKKEEAVKARNEKTRALVVWGGRQARLQGAHLISCEDRLTPDNTSPMMFPEEFEMVIKTLAQHRPATYLEWGSGKSTSFYPLLASGKVAVIDGYPRGATLCRATPWSSASLRVAGYHLPARHLSEMTASRSSFWVRADCPRIFRTPTSA